MEDKINKIICGDCIEEMKNFPDNSIDVIFADPPYYLQLQKGKRLKRANGTEVIPVDDEWDKFKSYEDYDLFTKNWLKEAQRILKPTGTMWVIGMYHNIFRVGAIMQNLGIWFLNDVINEWWKTNERYRLGFWIIKRKRKVKRR